MMYEALVAVGVTAVVLLLVSGGIAFVLLRRIRKTEIALSTCREELSQTEERLAAVPCAGFLVLHPKAHASPGLGELFGLDPGQPANAEALAAVMTTESAAEFGAALKQLASGNRSLDLDAGLMNGRQLRLFLRQRGGGADVQRLIWIGDITDDQRAKRRLEAEAEELRAWLDAVAIPLWRRDGRQRLVDCNRTYATSLEASRDEVVSTAGELVGTSKAQEARQVAERAQRGEAAAAELHVVIGGARRLLEIREQSFDGAGTVGFALDKTDLEECRAELGRHLEAHEQVLENLGTAIAIYGSDLRLQFFNTAYSRLWNIDESLLRNEPFLGDVLEAMRDQRRLPEYPNFPAFKQEFCRTVSTLIAPREELMHLPDNSTLLMVVAPYPEGGVLFSFEDVTDRLALERSYNTLIEVQQETLDKLYEGVAFYGADGRLKLFNPAFAGMWHLEVEFLRREPHLREVLSSCHGFFSMPQDEWDSFLEMSVASATDLETRSGRLERSDASVVDWAQVPLPDGAVLFTYLDVSDSIRAERALRERNEALETADRLKSEFIANISYELRTPLNAIVGFAEILENQFFGELNDRQLEYSRGIVESSQRLIALINDILDLASIEAGYLQLDLEPVDIPPLLGSVYSLGRERAHNLDIELKLDCPPDIGTIVADPTRLRQALFSLLSNSLKFTNRGGRVEISARRKKNELLLIVSDSGIGIGTDDQQRIFGKFERGGRQTRATGAGLGLSLVKSLIELHGGSVELHSQLKKGTRVTCRIPLNLQTSSKDPVVREAPEE